MSAAGTVYAATLERLRARDRQADAAERSAQRHALEHARRILQADRHLVAGSASAADWAHVMDLLDAAEAASRATEAAGAAYRAELHRRVGWEPRT